MNLEQTKSKYSQSVLAVEEYYKKYLIDEGNLKQLAGKIDTFSVVTPIIGAFSSGKSSLINMLIGQNILPIQITPETSIATELTYSDCTSCKALFKNMWRNISIEEIKNNGFTAFDTELLTVRLSSPVLKDIPTVTLVDIPGLDSGIEAHNKAIDNYLAKSLAYIVTVDAEQGLKESVIKFLKELKLLEMPVLIVLTKCDKKTPEDIEAMLNDVKEKAQSILGLEKFSIVTASARSKDDGQIKKYLQNIQMEAGEIFTQTYSSQVNEGIKQLKTYLRSRIDKNDTTIEDIEEQERLLSKQLEEIIKKVEVEKQKFSAQIERAITLIEDKIRTGLEGATETFIKDILAKRDIKPQINTIVRTAVGQGVKSEIEPKIQSFFKNITDLMNVEVPSNIEISIDPLKAQMNVMMKETVKKVMPLALAAMGFAVAGPIGAIVVGVLSVIADMFFEKKKQADERTAAMEKVKGEIIPAVSVESCLAARSSILAYVEEIHEAIGKTFIRDKELKEKALEDLKHQKMLKKEEQERIIGEMKQDLIQIESLCV